MAASKLARLRALFEEVKDRPAAERAAAIDRAVSGSEDGDALRRDLGRLLVAYDEDSSVLERPAYELAGLTDESTEDVAGRTIGPYTIEALLGRGGMGVVYRARSEAPKRSVALKVVRGGLDAERAARLEREARLLADLAHPGIVPLFDQGRTADGAPWFAMELVDGVPLDRFVRDGDVAREERLRLFLELAEAVEHAHRKGVIHRDLKPANVLVVGEPSASDGDGSPGGAAHLRVLDFGLAARTTGLELTLSTRLTEPGRLLGTLAYMSPEQARSEEVDQRTDVYALGVILYELLTDARPVDVEGSWIVEAMERIAESSPRPPRAVDPSIDRDLEIVTTTALEKDPARRYQSVAALADDVRRALAGDPILARPPAALEQLGRTVRRHPTLSATLAALLVLVLVGGTLLAVRELRHARAIDRQRAEAEAIVRFQDRLFAGDETESDPRLADLLDRAAALVDEELAGRPTAEAAVRHTLGRTYDGLGLYDASGPLLERALELRTARLGPTAEETRGTRRAWAIHLLRRGAPLESAEAFARLEADARAVAGEERREWYELRAGRATGLRYGARLDEAEEEYRVAIEGLRRTAGEDDEETLLAVDGLISTLRLKGETEEAETLLRDLLPRARRAMGDDADITQAAVSNLTRFLQMRGRLDEAEALQVEVLAQREESLGPDHPLTLTAMNNLSSIRYNAGRFAEAAATMKGLVEKKEALLGRDHPTTLTSLGNLAVMRAAAGRHGEALELLDEVLERQTAKFGAEGYVTLGTRNVRAQVLIQAGRVDEGLAAARESADLSLRVLGGAHPDTQLAWSNLGAQLRNLERIDEAVVVLEKTVELCDDAQGPRSSEAQWARYNLAVTLRKAGRVDDSLARWRELLAIPDDERTESRGFPHLLRVGFGNTLHELGRHEEAVRELEAGLEGMKRLYGASHPRTVEAAKSAVLAYEALGRDEEAARLRAFVERGGLDE
ncbi:MAG: tetratricopeptide repeat protein [Planctomycetota bacterium JB042]